MKRKFNPYLEKEEGIQMVKVPREKIGMKIILSRRERHQKKTRHFMSTCCVKADPVYDVFEQVLSFPLLLK